MKKSHHELLCKPTQNNVLEPYQVTEGFPQGIFK